MNENNIVKLISRFEKSLEETEKLTSALMGLESVLEKLDISMSEVYELTKVEDLTQKSACLLESIDNLNKVQKDVNDEYNKFINLKLYNEDIKQDLQNLTMHLISVDENLISIKTEIKLERKNRQDENEKFKKDLILSMKDILSLSLEKEYKSDELSEQENKN